MGRASYPQAMVASILPFFLLTPYPRDVQKWHIPVLQQPKMTKGYHTKTVQLEAVI